MLTFIKYIFSKKYRETYSRNLAERFVYTAEETERLYKWGKGGKKNAA